MLEFFIVQGKSADANGETSILLPEVFKSITDVVLPDCQYTVLPSGEAIKVTYFVTAAYLDPRFIHTEKSEAKTRYFYNNKIN